MTTKPQKIRIGLFVVATASLAAVMLIVLGGMRFWEGHDHYTIRFDGTVMGLENGAIVYLNGIKVGVVDDIDQDPSDLGKVIVAIKVKAGTPIHADTRAMLQLAGITGLKVIDLREGTSTSPPLAPGSTIAQGATIFDKLEKQANNMVDESTKLITQARTVVDNLARVTDPKKFEGMAELMASAKTTSANLADASTGLKEMIGENRVGLRRSLASIEQSVTSARELMDNQIVQLLTNANALVTDMKGVVHDNQGAVKAAVADLRQASRSFKDVAREVRQKPSRLLYGASPGERKLP